MSGPTILPNMEPIGPMTSEELYLQCERGQTKNNHCNIQGLNTLFVHETSCLETDTVAVFQIFPNLYSMPRIFKVKLINMGKLEDLCVKNSDWWTRTNRGNQNLTYEDNCLI